MNEEVERYDPEHEWGFMLPRNDGEYVKYSDYEKLLAKYNGVFYWVVGHVFEDFDTAEDVKKEYEESLSEIQTSKKE